MIGPEHPSYNCTSAHFLFQISFGGKVRLIQVEARNVQSVITIESIVGADNMVSPTCSLLAVYRQAKSCGVRSDSIEEISYIDFMTDLVDPDKLLKDPNVAQVYQASLAAEARDFVNSNSSKVQTTLGLGKIDPVRFPAMARIAARLKKEENRETKVEDDAMGEDRAPSFSAPKTILPPPPVKVASTDPQKREKLNSALLNLGFDKSRVRDFINGLGSKMESESIEDLLRSGISGLAK